jgi:leucyl/phenylalanyl-tRNA---protein transferase
VPNPLPPDPIESGLLLLAYRSGIFPMADSRHDPDIFWVEPQMRAILPLDGLQVSRSLARVLRRDRFRVTCNLAFEQVMEACAAPRQDGSGESWISLRIQASYVGLHRLGHAHSVECWQGDALVGGLYGVGFDRVFCGESMFSRVPDASKVALAWLVAALRAGGASLLDCQFITPHLASLGAVEIAQSRYRELLAEAQTPLVTGAGAADAFGAAGGAALALPAAFGALLDAADAAGAGAASSSPGNFIAQSFTQTS